MRCPNCERELAGPRVLCPHCGAVLPEASPAQATAPTPAEPATPPRRRRALRVMVRRLLVVLVALIVLIGVLAGAAYLGLYYGERDREARRQEVVQAHYAAGIAALNEGRYERAVAEFEYVLRLTPGDALAQQGLTEAHARLAVKPTPTSEAAQSLAEQLLEQARASYAQEDWVAAARTLTQLRALDPGYAQDEVEDMLFTSLYNAGIAFLEQDDLEVGISYLDQAIALRPLDAEAVSRRNLAARYLDALSYWGVDWELCIERFQALYTSHPNYKDVAQRLYQAHLAYADVFVEQGEMCPAEIQYTQAQRLYVDPQVDAQRAEAARICLIATPVPVSGTLPLATPQPIAGFDLGRLAYPVYNGASGQYDLYALYADGRILRVAANADQPWWEAGTGRVAYRDRAAGALKLVLPEEGVPLQLLSPQQPAWPTLAPDSQRLAYAAPGEDGVWYVYVANVNGTGEPQRLAPGWAPAWGPTGLLAYTGCDEAGANGDACGIVLDNPDDGQPGTRLTNNENDTAVSWAPAGNLMAYMSNVTGNWDLFLLNPDGGVQQLTSDPAADGLPAWSPDGGRLAFVSDRGGNWAIHVTQLDGQNVRRLLDLGTALPGWENQRLSWAP